MNRLYELDEVSDSLSNLVPARLKFGIDQYVWYGYATGGFLRAVLTNSLFEAIGRADEESLAAIGPIVTYVYNAAPSVCWGDEAKYAAQIALGRKRVGEMENEQKRNHIKEMPNG